MIRVRSANVDDAPAWLRMREALWPEAESASHAREIDEFFAGKLSMPLAALIALDDRKPVGFAELSIRNYAEDCVTDRVAYLEGWYVIPEARRRGVGRALVAAAEQWALARCVVLAYVIARFVALLGVSSWMGALHFGLFLWIGFPVILLTGSVLWENVLWKVAAIHAGDWLVKMLVIPIIVSAWP